MCKSHDYCHVEMPTKDNNTIKYNHGEKSIKLSCINNPNESSTTEVNKHTPSVYSLFTHCSFDESKNKLNYYRGDDSMKKFCKDLRKRATKIINYEKKKMIPLTTEEKYTIMNKKYVTYVKKNLIIMIKRTIK